MNKPHLVAMVGKGGCVVPGWDDASIHIMARSMPGRRRMGETRLEFENTPANWQYIRERMPPSDTVTWSNGASDRWREMETILAQHEARASRLTFAATATVPAEAKNWPGFKTPPYEHQFQAWWRSKDEPSFALFMDMGTGKTKVALDTAAWLYLAGKIDAVLVIAPNGVNVQWVVTSDDEKSALEKHMSPLVPWAAVALDTTMSKPGKSRRLFQDLMGRTNVLRIGALNCEALSHASGMAVASEFLRNTRSLLVLDESGKFKNPQSARTQAMESLSGWAPFRRIMTGTPITKGLENYYSQFRILNSNILGISTYAAFKARYCDVGGFENRQIVGYKNVADLHAKVAPYIYAITKEEAFKGDNALPPTTTITRRFHLDKDSLKLYKQMKEEAVAQIDGAGFTAAVGASVHTKLKQIALGFMREKDPVTETTSVVWRTPTNNRIAEMLDVLEENGENSFVIWAVHHEDIDAICAALKKAGYTYGEYHGRRNDAQKAQAKADFRKKRVQGFVGNAASGGTGLDGLQEVATLVINYSHPDDAELVWQSRDRTNRAGQAFPVLYVNLVAMGTVEVKALRNLAARQDVATKSREAVRDLLEGGEY